MKQLGAAAVIALVFGAGGFLWGRKSCKGEPIVVAPPVVRIQDTVEVPPPWMLKLLEDQNKALASKPRRDTLYLAQQVLVKDSFPYPVYVKDTSSRFWWAERATFGQKPGDVTTVVTREPRSGKASVLQYTTPGPAESFVIDTSPRPIITFGKFVSPPKHHGFWTDVLMVTGSLGGGFLGGATVGCRRG